MNESCDAKAAMPILRLCSCCHPPLSLFSVAFKHFLLQ
jgi:hypothetical protein